MCPAAKFSRRGGNAVGGARDAVREPWRGKMIRKNVLRIEDLRRLAIHTDASGRGSSPAGKRPRAASAMAAPQGKATEWNPGPDPKPKPIGAAAKRVPKPSETP